MRRAALLFAAALSLVASPALAEKAEWEFAATGYWNEIRDGDSYASGIFIAKRDALHLEGRVNYEASHARSVFAGWTFSFGKEEGLSFEITPIVGGVTGDLRAPIAGFEATLAKGRFDFYVEAEYVHDRNSREGSYTYAWSELGFRPVENLRLGLVGQRTRAYGGEREFQRGGFMQGTYGKVTAGVYWFNPGSDAQVVVASIGLAF